MISKQVKSRIVVSCFLLIIAIIVSYFNIIFNNGKSAYANTNLNLIRIHVIANSNSSPDQDLKLAVRDAVLNATHKLFNDVSEKEIAKKLIIQNQQLIYDTAMQCIQNEGFDYEVTIQVGNFSFPEIDYGDFYLPTGNYEALRIIIGEGKGDNWWCVLFPPLCFTEAAMEAEKSIVVATPNLPEGNIQVKSRLWERISDTDTGRQIEMWWLAGLEVANSLTVPFLKLK